MYSGPLYKDHVIETGQIRVTFDYAEMGLLANDGPLTCFEVAGDDRIFFPAEARIEGGEVIVSSEYVLQPKAVRFGFSNTATPNLFNQEGLPASSFRTDDWPIVIKDVDVKVEYKLDAEAYLVTLSGDDDISEIKYTTNGDHPGLFGLTYRQPFYIDTECTIKALAYTSQQASDAFTSKEISLNLATFKPIEYNTIYDQSRSAGGDMALIDGSFGSLSANDGRWQGFLGFSMSVVLDFGERIDIEEIKLQILKDQEAGIFLPNRVLFEISNDGERYNEIYRKPLFHGKDSEVEIMPFEFSFNRPRKTRFVRISAQNIGECPPWHPRAGEKAWLMVDEITIN